MKIPEVPITLLMAHPDDEIIFGWPVLPYAKKVICCSNDRYNYEITKWKDRHVAIKEVCELLKLELVCLDYNSNFYQLPPQELNEFKIKVSELIKDEPVIFAHNKWGEYGHLDHILIHNLAKEVKKEIIVSDIMIGSDYTGFVETKKPLIEDYIECKNDMSIYKPCKLIYASYNGWTWSEAAIQKAKIYYDK